MKLFCLDSGCDFGSDEQDVRSAYPKSRSLCACVSYRVNSPSRSGLYGRKRPRRHHGWISCLALIRPYGKEKAQENLRSGVDDAMALLPVTRSRMDNLGDQRRTGLLTPQLIQRYSLLRAWEAERLAARSRIPADGIKAG